MTVGKKIAGGFVLAMAIFILVGLISYWSITKLLDTNDMVEHTYLVLTKLARVLSTVEEAETSQRGFIITEEEDFLNQHSAAAQRIVKELAEVRKLTSDNPNQQRRLDTLEPLI